MRELVLFLGRYGHTRDAGDRVADRLFSACVDLCAELAEHIQPLWLPTARSDELGRAMAHALQHLDRPLSLAQTAQAAGLGFESLSAFSRAFETVVGESPTSYRARMRDQIR